MPPIGGPRGMGYLTEEEKKNRIEELNAAIDKFMK